MKTRLRRKQIIGERLRWEDPAAYVYKKDSPVLSSERAPHKNKTVTLK
jgi:hypothetical protein